MGTRHIDRWNVTGEGISRLSMTMWKPFSYPVLRVVIVIGNTVTVPVRQHTSTEHYYSSTAGATHSLLVIHPCTVYIRIGAHKVIFMGNRACTNPIESHAKILQSEIKPGSLSTTAGSSISAGSFTFPSPLWRSCVMELILLEYPIITGRPIKIDPQHESCVVALLLYYWIPDHSQ